MDGVIFGLPGTSITLEIVRSKEPVPVDTHDQLCLYFPNQRARDDARYRLLPAGLQPVASHPYSEATGAVTYRDPDGREVVFAPFIYGHNEHIASGLVGEHDFPAGLHPRENNRVRTGTRQGQRCRWRTLVARIAVAVGHGVPSRGAMWTRSAPCCT